LPLRARCDFFEVVTEPRWVSEGCVNGHGGI
jgi:hypothetical protein